MKKGIVLLLILCLGFAAYGQDASKVTEILEAEQLTRAQASYIAVSWLDPADESLDFAETAQIALEQGLLVISAGTNVLRLVPPLIITEADIDEMQEKLKKVFES